MYDSDSLDDYSGEDDDALSYVNIFGFSYPDLARQTLNPRDRRRRTLDDAFLLNLMGLLISLFLFQNIS